MEGIEKMYIINYHKNLQITNVGSLRPGTGAKYLEVMEAHIPNIYIAVQWRRTKTISADNHILIDFCSKK